MVFDLIKMWSGESDIVSLSRGQIFATCHSRMVNLVSYVDFNYFIVNNKSVDDLSIDLITRTQHNLSRWWASIVLVETTTISSYGLLGEPHMLQRA